MFYFDVGADAGGACRSCFYFSCGEQERALRKSETKINAELSDLDKNIIVKEALLAQIRDGQASYEAMQQVREGAYMHNLVALLHKYCSNFCTPLVYMRRWSSWVFLLLE